jgi:hypothetical protein
MPPMPIDARCLALCDLLRANESVAIGMRLYEETTNLANHANGGRVKTTDDVNREIVHVRLLRSSAKFFVLCTHRADNFINTDGLCDHWQRSKS